MRHALKETDFAEYFGTFISEQNIQPGQTLSVSVYYTKVCHIRIFIDGELKREFDTPEGNKYNSDNDIEITPEAGKTRLPKRRKKPKRRSTP